MNENTKKAVKNGITFGTCLAMVIYVMEQRWMGDFSRIAELAVCDLFCGHVLMILLQSVKRSVST